MTDYEVAASNEAHTKHPNWKVVSQTFGGDDFDAMDNLIRGPATIPPVYTFRESNKVLLTVNMQTKTIDLHTSEIYNQGYAITNHGLTTILDEIKNMNLSLQFELDDARQKVKQYQWAMGEIIGLMDRIKLEWNTKPYMVSTVGDLLSKLDQFVRSKR